jgi:hypothetical protein
VTIDALRYRGPTPAFDALAASWKRNDLAARAKAIAARVSVPSPRESR